MAYRIKQSVIDVVSSLAKAPLPKEDMIGGATEGVIRAISHIGGLIGAPLGLIPALQDYYRGGRGKDIEFETANVFKAFRIPPQIFIELLRRGLLEGIKGFDPAQDMLDQGISNERLDSLITATEAIPNAQDVIRFAVKEVYSPATAEKFGQYQDFPDDALPDAEAIGMSKDTLEKYWAAHWDLPSPSMGYEMLHRGLITEDELKMLLKALDIMPFWRDKLINTSYSIPTRVDIRRFYDMGVVDDAYLRKIYTSLGYHGADLDAYVLWTKIEVTFPDILTRYKNGWITETEAQSEIAALGMAGDQAKKLWQTKVKNAQAERTATERDLTKAEIYKAVKTGRLDRDTGTALIAKMGYDAMESALLLDMNVPLDDTEAAKKNRLITKGDIASGLKSGILSEAEALKKLLALNYTPQDAAFLIQIYTYVQEKPTTPEKVAKLKQISKADITKAVKDGLITAEEGFGLLLDIGYAEFDANFILAIIPTGESHSVTRASQFIDLVNSYRSKAGRATIALPPSLVKAEDDLRMEQAKLNLLISRHAPDSEVRFTTERVKLLQINLDKIIQAAT